MHGSVRYLGWGERGHFAAIAVFWWLFVAATLTLQIGLLRRWLDARRQRGPVEAVPSRPLRPRTLAAVAAGLHLAMFSWLIALAWRCADPTGAALAAVIMVVLGVVAYVRARGRAGAELGRVAGVQVGVIAVAILLLMNLRANGWVAASRGISVAEASPALPTWIIPVLTVALVAWVALVAAASRYLSRR